MEKWTVFSKRADFSGIAERFGIDPVIARIIRNRDIVGDEAIEDYLYAGTEKLCDPFLLKGMDAAVRILKGKLADGAKIRIIGDYDIDGIMSSYILKTGLKCLGGSVDIKIPNRVTDGYGLNESLIRIAAEDQIDTIVTCDNGIAALTAVSLAKELGMTVIVTDHHEVLSVPDADAVVDPKQPGDTYPNKNICGAGVAWKLILALGGDPDLDLMQYAAIATVGDIVDLTGENRIIVREGLKRLRHTKNKGLIKLAEVNGIAPDAIDTYHIGFVIGPCLNASGRLDTAMRADALLEADSDRLAEAYASELKSLNDSRKSMTEKGVEAARVVIED
jgi:single-stranded-DNA-specific exonuclease